jgi:hypothetical protein
VNPLRRARILLCAGLWLATFRVVPYVGAGTLICPGCLGGAVGAMGVLGNEHRALFDASYATVAWTAYSLHGEERHYRAHFGAVLALGYEYMTYEGIWVRASAGVAHAFGPPILPAKERFYPAGSFGLGYKFQ